MFETLSRTQKGVSDELENAIENGMLPQSLLFSGPKGSSRLTAALDLSFYLTESRERSFLRSGRVVYLMSRSMKMETEAAIALFEKQQNDRTRLFLIQTVRKTLLCYHSSVSSLYENKKSSVKLRDDEGRGGTLFSNAAAIDALVMRLEDGEREEWSEIIESLKARLSDDFYTLGKKTKGATIDEIRAVQGWLEDGIDEKCVIIERPEDFTEGAKNSMLKMLEEPPAHSHIILISEHPSRILETILSRVRHFRFPQLPACAVSSVIGDIFTIYGEYASFDDFFFANGTDEEERKTMDKAAMLYSEALISGKMLTLDEENSLFSALEKIAGYDYFRSTVVNMVEKALLESGNPSSVRKAWTALSRAMERSDVYNMSIRFALDTALREASSGK